MKILSWVEFIQPDPRVLYFSPGGLLTQGHMYPEAAADFLQRTIADTDLTPAVPTSVRDYFEGARRAFIRGFFSYELFAVSWTISTLAEEFALGERFLDAIGHQCTFRNRQTGERDTQEFARFGDLARAIGASGLRPHNQWILEEAPKFKGSLGWLLTWAHERRILDNWLGPRWVTAKGPMYSRLMSGEQVNGRPAEWESWSQETRDRWFAAEGQKDWELDQLSLLRQIRNELAHPSFPFVMDPPSASRQIRHAAGFISNLWTEGR